MKTLMMLVLVVALAVSGFFAGSASADPGDDGSVLCTFDPNNIGGDPPSSEEQHNNTMNARTISENAITLRVQVDENGVYTNVSGLRYYCLNL